MQRQGLYPPPPGASPILGLECAGTVAEVGAEVRAGASATARWRSSPAEATRRRSSVDAGSALPVPAHLSFEEAAALPEVLLTVFLNVFQLGALPEGGAALVHGGGSGIGTAAIRMLKAVGGRSVVTAGSAEKCRRCKELGADRAVNYRDEDFVAAARELTGGRGVDVVLDSIGAPYLERNLAEPRGRRAASSDRPDGRRQGRAEPRHRAGEARRRSWARRCARGPSRRRRRSWPASGRASAQPSRREPSTRSWTACSRSSRPAEAHRAMKASEHFGKIVLRVR